MAHGFPPDPIASSEVGVKFTSHLDRAAFGVEISKEFGTCEDLKLAQRSSFSPDGITRIKLRPDENGQLEAQVRIKIPQAHKLQINMITKRAIHYL